MKLTLKTFRKSCTHYNVYVCVSGEWGWSGLFTEKIDKINQVFGFEPGCYPSLNFVKDYQFFNPALILASGEVPAINFGRDGIPMHEFKKYRLFEWHSDKKAPVQAFFRFLKIKIFRSCRCCFLSSRKLDPCYHHQLISTSLSPTSGNVWTKSMNFCCFCM